MSIEDVAEEQIENTETPELEAETTTEVSTETEAAAAPETAEEDDKTKDQLHGLQRKTNKQKKEIRRLAREKAELEAQLAQINIAPPPKVDDYDTMEEYTQAAIKYGVDQGTQRQPTYDYRQEFVADLKADGAAKYSDFNQVAFASETMFEALDEMESPADIAYYLGKNPELAQRLSQADTITQVREFAKIEARLSTPKPRVSTAPAPVKPLESAPSTQKDPSQMSMEEYAAYRNKQRWSQGKV